MATANSAMVAFPAPSRKAPQTTAPISRAEYTADSMPVATPDSMTVAAPVSELSPISRIGFRWSL